MPIIIIFGITKYIFLGGSFLVFFPTPFEDELLYSVIARYHCYSGNLFVRETMLELFDEQLISCIPLAMGIYLFYAEKLSSSGLHLGLWYLIILSSHSIHCSCPKNPIGGSCQT